MYGDFFYKGNTLVISSYLNNGNSYAGNMSSLCWDGPRVALHQKKPFPVEGGVNVIVLQRL